MSRLAAKRDERSGRYDYGDCVRLCACGHELGVHLAKAPHACIVHDFSRGEQPCGCERFRLLREPSVRGGGAP